MRKLVSCAFSKTWSARIHYLDNVCINDDNIYNFFTPWIKSPTVHITHNTQTNKTLLTFALHSRIDPSRPLPFERSENENLKTRHKRQSVRRESDEFRNVKPACFPTVQIPSMYSFLTHSAAMWCSLPSTRDGLFRFRYRDRYGSETYYLPKFLSFFICGLLWAFYRKSSRGR